MQIRTFNDLLATTIAWLPILALLTALVVGLMSGVAHLEARTYGTDFFISNAGSVNVWEMYADHQQAGEEVIAAY